MSEVDLYSKINYAPIESIEAEDIVGFCQLGREEGLDLDYKSNWPADLEKLICAFANTQGGLILIGVAEEGKTRKPKLPVTGIMGEKESLHQKAMSIAADGVYPPVSPEIRVCELSDHAGNYVVLIRVLPSKLMHSTDQRRRVYVRIADNSRGYDLASVRDLEWLWQRKESSEQKRKELYLSAVEHSQSEAIPWNSTEEQDLWKILPQLHISIIPSFPNVDKVIETDRLLQVVRSLSPIRSHWRYVDRELPNGAGSWRSIPGGVCSSNRGYKRRLEYLEFGQMAHLHATIPIDTANSAEGDQSPIDYTWAYVLLSYIDLVLKFAGNFFQAIQYSWPITLGVIFESREPIRIDWSIPGRRYSALTNHLSDCVPDERLQLLNIEIAPARLLEDTRLLSSAAYNLFWAFGLGWKESDVSKWIAAMNS